MARRRLRRKQAKDLRHQPSFTRPSPASDVVVACEARRVERLAYNRTQAAQALGISRSTFNRRVLPHVDLIEMPWGAKLVPVDELERLLAERRRRRQAPPMSGPPGRPSHLAPDIVRRIHAEHAAGRSLRQIAAGLDADGIPTAHGGARWWPSTVRAVLQARAAGRGPY
jgi:hypothetical protein